jgi:hypothetical protein
MYHPKPVSEIVSEVIDVDDPNCFDSFDDEKTNRHTYLGMFARQIKKIFPHCQIAKPPRCAKSRPSVWVYHPNKSLCMGWIGYGNFKVNGSGQDTFVIHSRNIENNKYTLHNDQFYMVQNKQLDTAVRNARRYLRDYTPEELAKEYKTLAANHWGSTNREFAYSITTTRNEITKERHGDLLMRELLHLAASGHTWLSADFANNVNELAKIDAEKREAEASRDKRMYLVTTEIPFRGGGVEYRVCPVEDITATGGGTEHTNHELFTDQTIDRELVGKLAVLEMCEIDQWVDGVGYKPVDNVYYVCR